MKKYVAIYFKKTEKIIKKRFPNQIITMQFFQRYDNTILCGINEVLKFLKGNTDINKYKIKYLPEGSHIKANEVVLELIGKYQYFGIYEGIIDGILTRFTSLATNAHHIKQVTKKEIIFMGDRADHYINQKYDGYAVNVGGINTQVTDAQVKFHNGKAVGTIPHILIHAFNGDLVKTLISYQKIYPNDKIVALVDFNNDIVTDTLKVLLKFKEKLWAIRIDTAKNLRDKMFKKEEYEYGVTPNMIKNIRKVLDENNGKHVKIIISSNLNVDKIKKFEEKKAPVDIYGIGAALLKINNYFTADAVKLNHKNFAKYGRQYRDNKKLITYKF